MRSLTHTPSSKNFFAFQMVMSEVGEEEMTMIGVVFPGKEGTRRKSGSQRSFSLGPVRFERERIEEETTD